MGNQKEASLQLRGGTILTMNPSGDVLVGDVGIKDGRIVYVGNGSDRDESNEYDATLDISGSLLIPGLIQSHVHLAQTLFRGYAEDRSLLTWLQEKIWPFEAAHSEASLSASARLGIAELLLSGSTAALDMGAVKFMDSIFEAASEFGFRLTSGKAMMDTGDNVPEELLETATQSVRDAESLAKRWHGAENGLLHYAFAPRFVLSCTERLMRDTVALSRDLGCRLHTHACENLDEIKFFQAHFGLSNIEILAKYGFVGNDVVLAHCVHLLEIERQILAESATHVAHCPSTNLKLGSGIADVPQLQAHGINVGIGSDGAPCNNRMDMFTEMRAAALLQKPSHGVKAMSAMHVLRMATMGGARLLGIEHEVGSIDIGKRADLVIVSRDRPHHFPHCDPVTSLVFSCGASDVKDVMINGQWVVRDRALLGADLNEIQCAANSEMASLLQRVGN